MENDEDAALEEEEARALQVKMMKQLDTNDFDLDAFKINKTGKVLLTGEEISAKKLASNALGDLEKADELKDEMLQKIAKNLDKMSKKEKFDFLQQDSPELFELVRDFKEKVSHLLINLILNFFK
jgi:U3 small nucleolar RNA-associated protein 3